MYFPILSFLLLLYTFVKLMAQMHLWNVYWITCLCTVVRYCTSDV